MVWSMADILVSVVGTALFLFFRLLSLEQRPSSSLPVPEERPGTVEPLPTEETEEDYGDQSDGEQSLTSEGYVSDESSKDSSENLFTTVKEFVQEFIATRGEKEALQSFDDLPRGEGSIPETVTTAIVDQIMFGEMAERPARLELLRCLARERRLPEAALVNALSQILRLMEYMVIDAPDAKKYFVECCSVLISERALRPPFVSMKSWNMFNELLKGEDSHDATQLKMGCLWAAFRIFRRRAHPMKVS